MPFCADEPLAIFCVSATMAAGAHWWHFCHIAAIELQGPAQMNENQHRRRIVLWLGSFPVIAVFVLLILVLLLSDRTAPVISKIPVGSNPIHQADEASKVMSLASESISAESS